MVIEFQSHDPELAARAPTPSPTATWCCSRPRARTRPRRRRNGCWARSTICARRSPVPRRGSRTSAPSQPVRRHKQHHAVEPAARRGQFAAQQRARAEGRRGIEGPMIREMLQSGRPIEASECSTRPGPAPVRAARDAARPACRTVLDAARRPSAHQGMKAQILDIDRQIARRPARSPVRWKTTPASTARASTASTPARPIETPGDLHNGQDVQLRALEREAKAQRDLLESYLAKYREATTRGEHRHAPSDGRIISRAIVSNPPAFPKSCRGADRDAADPGADRGLYRHRRAVAHDRAARPCDCRAGCLGCAGRIGRIGCTGRAGGAPLRDRPAETPAAASEIERLAGALREAGPARSPSSVHARARTPR